MKLRLTLEYDLAEGWLAPYIAGLRDGRAVAACCMDCKAVSFPPLRVCACGGRQSTWVALEGTAKVIWRAMGADGDFALVRFNGAATASVARVELMAPSETAGRIAPAATERPGLVIVGNELRSAP